MIARKIPSQRVLSGMFDIKGGFVCSFAFLFIFDSPISRDRSSYNCIANRARVRWREIKLLILIITRTESTDNVLNSAEIGINHALEVSRRVAAVRREVNSVRIDANI